MGNVQGDLLIMADLKKIKTELNKLTILEVAELVKELEEEWGVSAAAPVAVAAAPGAAAGAAEAAPEKDEFDVILNLGRFSALPYSDAARYSLAFSGLNSK